MGRSRTRLFSRAALGAVVMTSRVRFRRRDSTLGLGRPRRPRRHRHSGSIPGYASVTNLKSLEAWLGRNANYVVQFGDHDPPQFVPSVWGEVIKAGALQTLANQVTLVESVPLGFGAIINASTAAGQASARSESAGNRERRRTTSRTGRRRVPEDRRVPERDHPSRLGVRRRLDALVVEGQRGPVGRGLPARADLFRLDLSELPLRLERRLELPAERHRRRIPATATSTSSGSTCTTRACPARWPGTHTTKSWSRPGSGAGPGSSRTSRFQRDFAIAHGKPVSYPEWALTGVTATVTSRVGGDDPTFIQGMSDWMNSLPAAGPGSLAYQSYFNEDAADGHHRIDSTYFPNAALRFQTVFGLGTTVTLTVSSATSVTKEAVVLSATPTNADGSPASGTVTFMNGTKLLASVAVTNGVALVDDACAPPR